MKPDAPELLKDYPIILTLPILWGDQDAFGHVNNVVYFRWCESARVAYLNDTGLQDLMSQANLGPILASIKCDYLRQLNFPDTPDWRSRDATGHQERDHGARHLLRRPANGGRQSGFGGGAV